MPVVFTGAAHREDRISAEAGPPCVDRLDDSLPERILRVIGPERIYPQAVRAQAVLRDRREVRVEANVSADKFLQTFNVRHFPAPIHC